MKGLESTGEDDRNPKDSGELLEDSQRHCAVSSRLRRGVDDRTRTTGSESWESVLPSCGRLVRMNLTKGREVSRVTSHQENDLTITTEREIITCRVLKKRQSPVEY